jgi:hypothetical protein
MLVNFVDKKVGRKEDFIMKNSFALAYLHKTHVAELDVRLLSFIKQ